MSRPDSNVYRTSNPGQRKRLQQLVVRVGTLPMAAAMALGANMPWAAAQTVITPLSGPAATQTLVTRAPEGVTVTTGTLRDGNAFNNFSAFQVGAGDRVGLVVPQGAHWLVNVVRDSRVQVDGLLQGQLANGSVGGNLLFIDRHGFAVGPQGRVQAGRLVFAAPSSAFVDGLLADGPGLGGARVGAVLGGAFDRSDTGAVRIDGVIETTDGVQIMAGRGADSAQAVSISGQVGVAGRQAGSAVNLGNLRSLAPVVVRDGVIDITTPGDIVFNGKLLADGSHWSDAGAVRVVAGGNITLGSASVVSASAGEGSGAQGGTVSLFAHDSASNAAGAVLAARGDGVGAGGFIELSAARSVQVGGLTLDAGSDLGQTGLAYIDPEDLTVTDSLYTNGANLLLEASKTLQVNTGVALNTRRVTTDAASSGGVSSAATAISTNAPSPSVGDSGNITLFAPSITVQAGATLDASVINQSGAAHQAGDITLTARQTSSGETLLSLAQANAAIDVAGTLTGRNISLEASIESAASFGGTSGSIQQEAINLALGDLPFAASLSYVQARGDAGITLRETAVLAATESIGLTALADRSVSVETEAAGSAKANLSAGFSRVLGTTEIDVKGGASLTAGTDLALVAASKTTVAMASSAAGETDEESGAANVASIVFAGSMSDVTTSVNVAAGAMLESGGDTLLRAFHSGQYDTSAEVTVYGGGTAGVVGALSLQKSSTGVTLGGVVNAQGNVSLMAMNASAKNAIAASATNASEEEEESALAGLPESLTYSKDDAGAAAEAGLLASFTAMTGAFSDASDKASGGTPSESKAPALRLAGAMTWSQSNHTTLATLADGGVITAGGDAMVDAQTLVGQLQSVALAEATSETDDKDGSKVGLGVAFNFADHSVTTRALVGADAAISAGHVAVNASTDVPEFYTAGLPLDLAGAPVDWGSFSAAYETVMAGTDPLYDGFNTRVGATSSATNLAAAGAVSLSFMKNDTRAWVDSGAQITSTVADGVAWSYDVREVGFESDLVEMLVPINTYTLDKDLGVLGDFVAETRDAPQGPDVEEISFSRRFDAAVVVRATNNVQTLHLAGGTGPEAGGGGTSVGGTFSMVSRDNTAVAGIADRAVVQTSRLDVAAETTDWVLSLSPTSGQGAGVAANGIASFNQFKETTRASISREAMVSADSVNVDAQLSLGVIALTGAVTRSEGSGVGIGVAMNDMVGNTQAFIGDNDTDGGGADTAEGLAGFVKTSQLAVQARSDGTIVAVGVAGATAGQDNPAEKSAGDNLGAKAETKSADTQTQLDGNDSTMAPLGEASAPIAGEDTEEAAAADADAGKPPKFAIAGAGALVTNHSDIDTTALLDGAVVRALDVGVSDTTTVAVRALSDLTQVSAAGGGALAMAKNASTSFSAAVAGAVAIQDSDDDTSALIRNHTVVSDLADRSGALVVQALKSGERTAVGTAISLNLSKGSTTSVAAAGSVSATQTSDDTSAGIEGSTITGEATTPTALGVQVVAYDRSRIGAGGGALSVSTGKGSASVGAAISIVDMRGSTSAAVSGGTMNRVHDLAVAALSSQKVVGLAAVASAQTDASSKGQLTGAFVFNQIGTTVSAGVKSGATVNITGDLAIQAGGAPTGGTLDALLGEVLSSELIDYELVSTDNGYTSDLKNAVGGESILGVAGTLGLTLGSNAASLGLSYAHNSIQTSYDAELNGRISAGGGVSVQALSTADIVGISVGLGATKGKFSGMGSASVNLIGQRTRALVTGGSVTASGLEVSSQTRGNQFSLAGNLSIAVGGGSGNAAGAAVSYTLSAGRDYTVGEDTSSTRSAGNEASISGAEVNVGMGDVVVAARHTSDTQSVAAAGAASDGTAGFAGTLSFTDVGGVTNAVVHNTDLTAGTVSVTAGEAADGRTASSLSVAGGVALSKGYAGALAVAWNTQSAVRSARITQSDLVVANTVTVESSAQGAIETLAVAVTAGKDGAASGSIASNFMISDTSAEFSGGSLSGTATRLVVRSTGSSSINALAGAVSAGGTNAAGGALATNSVGEGADNFRVRTRVANTTLAAPVAVTVSSSLAGSIDSIAASGSGSGTAALNGSVTVNAIEADVSTEVSGVIQSAAGGAFRLSASNEADIASLAGTISGAGTGAAGAAVSVNKIGGNVSARAANSTLRATGALEVDASSSGSIRSVAAGAAGGGTVALAGSNTTNAITSTVLAQLDNVTQAVASSSLRVQALDSSTIQSFAGSVAGGGTAAGGAAFALNFLGRTALNADSSKLVQAQVLNSSLQSGGAVQVKALSTSTIESLGMAVGASGNAAVTGSNTTNLLEDDISATWSGGSFNGSATTLTVQADDAATVRTLAGNFSGGTTGAFGAAIAVNEVGSVVHAKLSDMNLGAATAVVVDADLRGQIRSVAASGAVDGVASVNGSFTTNEVNASVKAQALDVVQFTNGGSFAVSADNDADIFSIAGTVSGSGGAAVGAAVAVNDIGGDVTARLADSALRSTGAVSVLATSSGTIQSVAAGVSGGGSLALAGSNSTNGITSTVLAQVDSVNLVVSAASVAVLARDISTIQSFAGTVAGGGAASGGAALALNFLGRTATNANSSKRVAAEVTDSVVRSAGAVGVNAHSTSTIESVGVAAGVSGTTAITGSNSTNLLEDEIAASWAGSELISTGTLTVTARQSSGIDSLAGNVSGSLGASVGAAVAVNRIGTDTNASLVGVSSGQFNLGVGHWTQYADDVVLSADSDNQINTIAVGMSAGSVGVQGSVAVSVIDALTSATLGADGFVTNVIASDSVAVTANSRDRVRGLAGAVALGAAGVGAAGGVQTNIVTSTTSAGITGADTHVNAFALGDGLTVKDPALLGSPNLMNINALSDSVLSGASHGTRVVKGLAVQATSIQQIGALTAVAGGGAAGAAGASVNVDQIGGSTRATIDSARFINDASGAAATQTVDVMATNHAMVASSVTALAIGGTAGVSGSVGTETIDRSTRAEIVDGAIVNARGAVSVNAVSTNTVAQIAAGAAGGGVAGVAGSGDVVLICGDTAALIDNAMVRAGRIAVVADGANRANLIAGSIGGGGAVGVGLSFTVAVSGSTVSAVVNDSALMADGAVVVDADNRTESLSVSASGAVGGVAGVAVGATVTVMEGATRATLSGTSTVGRRTLATGLLASAGDAPVTINLASDNDLVGTGNQTSVRFSLSDLAGRVDPASAVVTVSDGETTVTAVRQADGTYAADVSGLADGVLLAQLVLTEDSVQKVSSTTLLKSTGINDLDNLPQAASLPAATTRISTLSGFDEVDARNHAAVRFVLKGNSGPTADSTAVVTVSDGARSVAAQLNADGSYTADVRSLGDGVLTALVSTSAGQTSRTTLTKASGAGSLSVTANEHIVLNSNAGQIGVGGVAGVGASANLVIGRSTVDASVNATSVRVSDALTVAAARDADIDMITATGGGGGFVGVSGAVGVLIFGSAPDGNANSELTGSNSTLGQINTATQSDRVLGTGTALSSAETAALNDGARYDTQGAFSGASGNHRTSATLAAPSIVAGSVSVLSLDRTAVDNNAGAIAAGGLAGVSAGVAVTLLGGANHAGVSVGQLSVAGDVTIESGTRTPGSGKPAIESRAVAGAGGFVGVGAAVSVASNATANTAVLAGRLSAGGAVSVKALDETSLLSEAFGSTAGVLSVGVVTATATQTGSVGTTLSGQHSGQGLAASAERNAGATAQATGGSAGVYAGSGAGASASDSGAVSLSLASGTVLDAGAGDLVLSARANPGASTQAIGVSVGRTAGLGVSVAQSSVDTSVQLTALGPVSLRGADLLVTAVLGAGDSAVSSQAVAGGGGLLLGLQGAAATSTNTGVASVSLGGGATLAATGDVGISANDAMRITAGATGVGVGFVGAGVAVAMADSDTSVSTSTGALGGRVLGNLTVSARGDESVDADAVAGSGGVVAGAGADARVTHDQAVSATASTAAAGLTVLGTTTLSADRKVRYDSQTQTINASAFGGSGAVTTATLNGSATATLGHGSTLTGAQLRLLASNDVERTDLGAESARGGGGGVLAGAGASAVTDINGTATAEIGDDVTLNLGGDTVGLLELRAYNQLRGSSVGRLDLGGAIPVALVDTQIRSNANANAKLGARDAINVAGEVYINALSYVDIEANTITKTYGAAAGAQGDALALANVTNQVTVGVDTNLVAEGAVTLLAGQDRDFWRNKSFVTARADLFNHAAVPVSVNPDVRATLNLNNNVTLAGDAVRSGGTIQLGGITGSHVVEGKGKVNDWTRDVGELVGVSSEYGSSSKTLNANVALSGVIEAGFGNKQRVVIAEDGRLSDNEGNIRYSIGTEDLAATGAAYLDTLYAQLKNYGDIPEVRAFVEAEIAFYLETLLREGFAELEADPDTGETRIIAQENVPGTFITFQNVRAGSGNVELFGNNVTGSASITARADSEILIENNSPMNVRVKDLVIDSSGGFAKYNGTYLKADVDIASFNRDAKTGLAITVDSIDTRAAAGGGVGEELPTIRVVNNFVSSNQVSDSAVIATAPDGSRADLRQDQMRAPEIRVNGLVYNKLGPIILTNLAGSISVTQEDPNAVPRLDGLEVQVNAGKNFVLSSPSVSQSVGGSPESIYAVAYNDDQQRKLDNMGVVRCGTARAGEPGATSFNAGCLKNGTGGIYASGGIFLGARYLNINGTVQSGQSDFGVTLTQASVGTTIDNWERQWTTNRGSYLAQGKSPLVQVAGRRSTDSESDINKNFANGSITESQRNTQLAAMAARRGEPVVYYDAEDNRLKVASTEVTGGLVEVVGSIINTGGGVIRALDGYARFNIDNQTSHGLDLLGLDTGGDAGVVRITDLNRPVITDGRISAYEVTSYERNALGAFRSTTTAGRGAGAAVLRSSGSTLASPTGNRLASFSYAPVANSTYVWSAGYEFNQEKRYWYQKSSALWGAINLGSIKWNSIDTITKDATAMPEGIYVTTAGAPSQNFWMGAQTIVTDTEKETYYRSWKKCGPLCFKKTYYVDYRTEVGKKDIFTQRVRADHPIAIEMIGYGTGLIDVKSQAGVRLSGNISNDSGLVSIRSGNGSIEQLSGGTAVTGNDLRFYARTGMGSEGAPINVVTGTGSFTALSDSGNLSFQSLGGALRINQVSTTGKVWLLGDEDIVGVNPNTVHVIGSRIELSAPRGGIGAFNADGSVRSTLNIQTQDAPGGGITARAARGIALKQATGNLWVDQIASNGGDVYIQAGGDLIDNNRNETRDVRTEEELLALWDAAALQGSSAEDSRQQTLRTTRSQFRRYWALRNASATSIDAATGVVTAYTADSLNAGTYQFVYSDAERAQLAQSGMSVAQITGLEAARTQEVKDLDAIYGATQFQIDDDLVIAQVNAANLQAGRPAVDALSSWSDTELQSPLPNAIFSKSSTDTQTRIEEPNVVGNRVVLRPGGKIGRDDGSVTIDLRKEGGLTTDDRLTIMSAETDDMSLDKTNWLLTVVKKDTFNVLSNRLNVNSSGFVYLGADTTDAHPTGGDAHLEQVIGAGEVRIKVSGSILNAANSSGSVIQAHKAILEAASGSIGAALMPVTLTLTGGGTPGQATLVARAQDGIWLSQSGDMRVADVYSPGAVSLSASGSIIDARGERTRSIEADGVTLTALGGSVGSALRPMSVKTSLGSGVNASSALGYSIYLQGAETGLTVGRLSSGLDVDLYAAQGGLRVLGSTDARGRIDAEASGTGDFTMASGTGLRALTGDIFVTGDDVGLSQLDASRGVVVVARGDLSDTSMDAVNVNVAGRGVTLSAAGSMGSSARAVDVLTKAGTRLVAVAGGDAHLGSATASLRIGQVSAVGNAVISSGHSILDDRGTRAQAVDATNISFAAGGDVGQSNAPMTVRTASNGAVLGAVAGGSLHLKASSGVLKVRGASAAAGQMSLDGSLAGLSIGGDMTTATGLTLSAGTQALELDASARLVNRSGNLVLQGRTITVADGASVDGRAGAVVLSATGDITLTGIRSDNTSSGAIVVSTTGGSVLDGGDSATDLVVGSAAGGVVVSAQGSVGNTALASTAQDRSIETDAAVLQVTSKGDSVSLAQTSATRNVVISARTGAELSSQGSVVGTRMASQLGDVAVSSSLGGVSLTSITAGQDVAVAAAGKIELVAVTALRDIGLSSSGMDADGTGQGLTATTLTAGRHLNIRADGADAQATLTSAVARSGSLDVNVGGGLTMASATSLGALTLTVGGAASLKTIGSSRAAVTVTAGSTLNFSMAKALQDLTMRSVGELTGVSATSSAGTLDVASTGAGLKLTTAAAATGLTLHSAGALAVTTWSASRGAASITSGGELTFARGAALGHVMIRSGAGASLGTLSAVAGGITIESSDGPLTTGAVTAAQSLSLSSVGTLRTGALTSRTGSVQVDSLTGSVALSTVSARTSMAVTSGSSLTLTSFTVTAGGATLKAVTDFSVVRGTATGAIGLTMGGQGSLGRLTSSQSTLSAQSTGGGLRFTALKAARSITLSAAGTFTSGVGVGYSLYGGTLDAGTAVDVQSAHGGIQVTRLIARTASRLTTGSGPLTISAISLLPKGLLVASTGNGKRTVPVGY